MDAIYVLMQCVLCAHAHMYVLCVNACVCMKERCGVLCGVQLSRSHAYTHIHTHTYRYCVCDMCVLNAHFYVACCLWCRCDICIYSVCYM